MIDDIFVFDNVIHAIDLSPANTRTDRPEAQVSRQTLVDWGETYAPGIFMERRFEPDELYEMVFVASPTDMAMAQVVTIFDWFKDWFAPIAAQHAMATAYPDRVLFCGGVDPSFRGLDDALEQMEHQIRDMGARSMKFYNAHIEGSWRCDDEKIAYPMYERARSLGIKVLQFHKGLPFGLHNVEYLRPTDIQAPARDFPDLTFVIHHLAEPYFDEVVSIASRFPNVHLALSGNLGYYMVAPRFVQERLGRLLMEVGPDKLLWGSEAALAGPPGPFLKAFMDLEIPEDLRRGFGYPQITREDKEKILGLNMARLMGVDVAAKRREFAAVAG